MCIEFASAATMECLKQVLVGCHYLEVSGLVDLGKILRIQLPMQLLFSQVLVALWPAKFEPVG
jgi:hypothetical protein